MGLWHGQDSVQQHCSSTLEAGDKESSQQDQLAPGLVRLWRCGPGDSSVPAVMLLPQDVQSGM